MLEDTPFEFTEALMGSEPAGRTKEVIGQLKINEHAFRQVNKNQLIRRLTRTACTFEDDEVEGVLHRTGYALQGHEREQRSAFHCLIDNQTREHRIAVATNLQATSSRQLNC